MVLSPRKLNRKKITYAHKFKNKKYLYDKKKAISSMSTFKRLTFLRLLEKQFFFILYTPK